MEKYIPRSISHEPDCSESNEMSLGKSLSLLTYMSNVMCLHKSTLREVDYKPLYDSPIHSTNSFVSGFKARPNNGEGIELSILLHAE